MAAITADYYVYVNNGDNSDPGSLAQPWGDPQYAADNMGIGKTCAVRIDDADSWVLSATWDINTSTQQSFIFVDENWEEITSPINARLIDASGVADGIYIDAVGNYCYLNGCKISGPSTYCINVRTSYLSCKNVWFDNSGSSALYVRFGAIQMLENFIISNCADGGTDGWCNFPIKNGLIYGCTGHGWGGGADSSVSNVIIHDCGVGIGSRVNMMDSIIDGCGIALDTADFSILKNNIITNNTTVFRSTNAAYMLIREDTFFYNNDTLEDGAAIRIVVDDSDVNLGADPFVDRANDNFTLTYGATGTGVETDIDGTNKTYPDAGLQVQPIDEAARNTIQTKQALNNENYLHLNTITVGNATELYTISPAVGSINGGNTVFLNGVNFDVSGNTVSWDGSTVTINSENTTSISITAPSHAVGAIEVIVGSSGWYSTISTGYTYQDTAVPSVPTSVVATAISEEQIQLTWDFMADTNYFDIYRASTVGAIYTITATGIIDTDWTNSGLNLGDEWFYKIKGVNDVGESGFSSITSATVLTVGLSSDFTTVSTGTTSELNVSAPDAPTGVNVTGVSTKALLITWDFNQNTETFELWRATTENGSYSLIKDGIIAISASDGDFDPETGYWYKVKAVNGFGTSPFSTAAYGRTQTTREAQGEDIPYQGPGTYQTPSTLGDIVTPCEADDGDFIYTSRIKDAVLHFLQTTFAMPNLFSNQTNIFKYSEDERASRIMIADYNTENLNSINNKPAILVNRGSVVPQTLALGDKTNETFLAATEQRELLLNADMQIQCYSREGLEAETLAVTIFKMIRYLNEDIQKNYNIFNITARAIGSEQPIGDNLVMVPVSVQVAVPDAVCINFKEIQINKISLETAASISGSPTISFGIIESER